MKKVKISLAYARQIFKEAKGKKDIFLAFNKRGEEALYSGKERVFYVSTMQTHGSKIPYKK